MVINADELLSMEFTFGHQTGLGNPRTQRRVDRTSSINNHCHLWLPEGKRMEWSLTEFAANKRAEKPVIFVEWPVVQCVQTGHVQSHLATECWSDSLGRWGQGDPKLCMKYTCFPPFLKKKTRTFSRETSFFFFTKDVKSQ